MTSELRRIEVTLKHIQELQEQEQRSVMRSYHVTEQDGIIPGDGLGDFLYTSVDLFVGEVLGNPDFTDIQDSKKRLRARKAFDARVFKVYRGVEKDEVSEMFNGVRNVPQIEVAQFAQKVSNHLGQVMEQDVFYSINDMKETERMDIGVGLISRLHKLNLPIKMADLETTDAIVTGIKVLQQLDEQRKKSQEQLQHYQKALHNPENKPNIYMPNF